MSLTMQHVARSDSVSRQTTGIEMVPRKTNVIMLDTTTLLSLLIITVFIVQVFSLTIKTNNVQTLIGRKVHKRSVSSHEVIKLFKRSKRRWNGEYTWRKGFRKRNSFASEGSINHRGYMGPVQSYPG